MSLKLYLVAILSGLLLITHASAEPSAEQLANWHQFRGPMANGVAPEGNPPTEWSESKNVRWKVEVPGLGSSTPVIWNDKVFVLSAIETDQVGQGAQKPEDQPERPFGIVFPHKIHQFAVICLDRQTGKTLWQQVATEQVPHEGVHPDNDFASATPITDGKRLYVPFGSRGIYAYDMEGKLLWKRDLGRMQIKVSFGEGSSPALYRDLLIVPWDHEGESFIVALDTKTGETRWKTNRDEKTAWATPLVIETGDGAQVVTNASAKVRSYDAATGELLWKCGGQVGNVTPSPVSNGELVFCMSGFRGSALYALPLNERGDLTDTDKIVWKADRGTPYIPSPLLYGTRLWFTQGNEGIVSCLDAKSGKPLIERTRLSGIAKLYSSPVGAADRVYITSRDGATLVLKNADQFEVLAENRLEGDQFDASPAIAGKQLFIRSLTHLYCIEQQ
jgi:outer membrane protein assembly factor BamB